LEDTFSVTRPIGHRSLELASVMDQQGMLDGSMHLDPSGQSREAAAA
jgi:hypothetical protein